MNYKIMMKLKNLHTIIDYHCCSFKNIKQFNGKLFKKYNLRGMCRFLCGINLQFNFGTAVYYRGQRRPNKLKK